jgi:DNA-binding IclR family transcriptional regulator
MTLSEVASELGRSRNELFRMLICLERRGYIARRNGGDRFELTSRLFELAHRHPPTNDLVSASLPVMRRLAADSLQSCQMGIPHEGRVLIIAQVDSPGVVGIAVRVGARRELATSASGRVLLAFQEPSVRAAWLGAAGARRWSASRRSALERELRAIARRGVDEHPSAHIDGVTDISSPILDHGGRALAAITSSFVRQNHQLPSMSSVRRMVIEAAAEISRHIGGADLEPSSRSRAAHENGRT